MNTISNKHVRTLRYPAPHRQSLPSRTVDGVQLYTTAQWTPEAVEEAKAAGTWFDKSQDLATVPRRHLHPVNPGIP